MSISSISSSTATPVQASPPVNSSEAKPIKVAVPVASSQASALQEAAETPDVTKKEAAKGDRQAVKLLAQEAAAQSHGGKNGLNIKA